MYEAFCGIFQYKPGADKSLLETNEIALVSDTAKFKEIWTMYFNGNFQEVEKLLGKGALFLSFPIFLDPKAEIFEEAAC